MKNNLIYTGKIRHRRYTPFKRTFTYSIFMTYFDVSKIDTLFKKSFLWNTNKYALVSYQRKDYHGDPKLSLDESVRKRVKEKEKNKIERNLNLKKINEQNN